MGKKRNHALSALLCRATLLAGEPSVVLYWLLYSVARAALAETRGAATTHCRGWAGQG